MVEAQWIRAWRPAIHGVSEVYHAHLVDHVYPMHTHDTWTLLIVDEGIIRYDLERHEHGALNRAVTLLPPHVPHNGRPVTPQGFHKRVVYLDASHLPEHLTGPAVDNPVLLDPLLWHRIHRLHAALERSGEDLEAESRLVMVAERLRDHLNGSVENRKTVRGSGAARALRDLIDTRIREGITLQEASAVLHTHPAHLVRVFGREFGVSPHRYLIGRRIDLARKLLLDGMAPHSVAVSVGFYDQSHFHRHFQRTLGTSPGRYARGARPRSRHST